SIMKYYAPVSKSIGIYWFHFGQPIIPPIVDQLTPTVENGKVLLYMPFESVATLTEITALFPQQQFICYHQTINEDKDIHNVQYRRPSYTCFKEELKACSGIITNAGFSLISEALVLGKKILAKPLIGQFEQIDNVHCLKQLGLAYSMDEFDPAMIKK